VVRRGSLQLCSGRIAIRDYLRYWNLSVTNKCLQSASETKRPKRGWSLPFCQCICCLQGAPRKRVHPNSKSAKL
jgi:hypothetical protein